MIAKINNKLYQTNYSVVEVLECIFLMEVSFFERELEITDETMHQMLLLQRMQLIDPKEDVLPELIIDEDSYDVKINGKTYNQIDLNYDPKYLDEKYGHKMAPCFS